MKLNARSAIVFPLILLSLLALLTFWINNTVQPPLPKLDGSSRHDPDYIMSNFVTTQTDINGDLRYRLAAVEMKHYPDDDSTTLLRPRYTQFALDKPYTQVEGLHGYVSSNGENVKLVNNVKVTRQAFAGKGEMTIETELLNIRPNDDLVHTESPVVIRQAPKTVIHATGMIYEKKKSTLTLLHKVRAHYERPRLTAKTVDKKQNSGTVASEKAGVNDVNVAPPPAIEPKTSPSKTNNARIRRRYE